MRREFVLIILSHLAEREREKGRERERDRERERERETFGQNRKEIDRPKLFVRNLYGKRLR